MSKALMTIGVMAISAAACGRQPAGTGATRTDAPSVTMTLPAGDVTAGRQAFMDLKCTTCHTVPSEPGFPPLVSANPGPLIDARLSSRDVSYLATAIMSPAHEISPNISDEVRASVGPVLSPMGDFSRAMTVRQLIDLHAFLRSIK